MDFNGQMRSVKESIGQALKPAKDAAQARLAREQQKKAVAEAQDKEERRQRDLCVVALVEIKKAACEARKIPVWRFFKRWEIFRMLQEVRKQVRQQYSLGCKRLAKERRALKIQNSISLPMKDYALLFLAVIFWPVLVFVAAADKAESIAESMWNSFKNRPQVRPSPFHSRRGTTSWAFGKGRTGYAGSTDFELKDALHCGRTLGSRYESRSGGGQHTHPLSDKQRGKMEQELRNRGKFGEYIAGEFETGRITAEGRLNQSARQYEQFGLWT